MLRLWRGIDQGGYKSISISGLNMTGLEEITHISGKKSP